MYTVPDELGFYLGLVSIACWLFAQLPQMLRNYRLKSAESLSPYFLAEWLAGDAMNLSGCLFAGDQLPSQVYTACYFVCVDVGMIAQYAYYALSRRDALALVGKDLADATEDDEESLLAAAAAAEEEEEEEGGGAADAWDSITAAAATTTTAAAARRRDGRARASADADAKPRGRLAGRGAKAAAAACVVVVVGVFFFAGRDGAWSNRWASHRSRDHSRHRSSPPSPSSLPYCDVSTNPEWEVAIGRAAGYVSSAFYLGSRVSQILKNRARKSCEGLSAAMFATAVAANVTYGVAILLRAASWAGVLASAPWLLGSLGTVALDVTVLAQSRRYGGGGGGGGGEEGEALEGEETAALLPSERGSCA